MFRSFASRPAFASAFVLAFLTAGIQLLAVQAAYSLGGLLLPLPVKFASVLHSRADVATISRIVLENGDVVETRSVSGAQAITAIDVSGGGIVVEVTCQQESGVQVIGDPDAVRSIETDIDDGQLQISGSSWHSGKRGVIVKVGVGTLDNIQISGANTVKVVRLLANHLDIEMSGACMLDISGKAKKLTIEASGACIVNAKDLIAEKIVVEADGASKIIVNAEKQLCASVSGVSKVVYYGEPKNVNKDVCGMGRVVQQTSK
ncbi:MAG: DUF2807 domain-containing protein [Candidatus Kapaibacterium sp.]|nr:MAG: DUF2807 domain-containing protein [Candidatus Kapabacteria bacterium]